MSFHLHFAIQRMGNITITKLVRKDAASLTCREMLIIAENVSQKQGRPLICTCMSKSGPTCTKLIKAICPIARTKLSMMGKRQMISPSAWSEGNRTNTGTGRSWHSNSTPPTDLNCKRVGASQLFRGTTQVHAYPSSTRVETMARTSQTSTRQPWQLY